MVTLGIFLSVEKKKREREKDRERERGVWFEHLETEQAKCYFLCSLKKIKRKSRGNIATKTCTIMCSCRLKSYMALYSSRIFFRSTSERLTSTLSRVSSQVPWRCATHSLSSDKCTTLQHCANIGNTKWVTVRRARFSSFSPPFGFITNSWFVKSSFTDKL